MNTIKKYLILILSGIAGLLLLVAAMHYPGGSYIDPASIGYDWQHNYITNLLSPQAVNGADNSARPWAVAAVIFLSVAFALFFIRFSKKISNKGAANVIRYAGLGSALGAMLTVVPSLHDAMITPSSVCSLLTFFYIMVFLLKSRLMWPLKILSILTLLLQYLGTYMYFAKTLLEYLPLVQKTVHLMQLVLILILEYFSTKEDFAQIKS